MKVTSNSCFPVLLLSLIAMIGNACAVEHARPSIEVRVRDAELVIVADDIELLPHVGREFDKFFRIKARVASVLKGQVKVGDRVEVVVDNTIAEHRNDCCVPDNVYVLFLREHGDNYHFVGSPSAAILIELQRPQQAL